MPGGALCSISLIGAHGLLLPRAAGGTEQSEPRKLQRAGPSASLWASSMVVANLQRRVELKLHLSNFRLTADGVDPSDGICIPILRGHCDQKWYPEGRWAHGRCRRRRPTSCSQCHCRQCGGRHTRRQPPMRGAPGRASSAGRETEPDSSNSPPAAAAV